MKKSIFISLVLILLVWAAPGFAKTFDISLATTGTTTVATGGVSVFALDLTTGTSLSPVYDLYPQLSRYYSYGLQISSVTPTAANAAKYSEQSGSTYTVYAKFKSNDTDVSWDDVPAVSIMKNESMGSSTSPYMVTFTGPPADLMRLYFETTGVTPFGGAEGKLIASEIPIKIKEIPIVVEEGTFTMPAAGTGVSQFTAASIGVLPQKVVGWGSFMPISGASCFATTNGDTPSEGIGFTVYKDDHLRLSGNEARNVKFVPGVEAVTIRYQLLTVKP